MSEDDSEKEALLEEVLETQRVERFGCRDLVVHPEDNLKEDGRTLADEGSGKRDGGSHPTSTGKRQGQEPPPLTFPWGGWQMPAGCLPFFPFPPPCAYQVYQRLVLHGCQTLL